MKLADTSIRSLPKVLLHDHLDGGLRPQTTIELVKDQHYKALPTTDAGDLAKWFYRGAPATMTDIGYASCSEDSV